MKKREYFIKAGSGKFSYNDWKVVIEDRGKYKIAKLGDGKEFPFRKIITSSISEQDFAGSVLKDLVGSGLKNTIKKYGFTPRFKSIVEDGVVDKRPGVSPHKDRVTNEGIVDKRDFKVKDVDRSVIDEGVLDKRSRLNRSLDRRIALRRLERRLALKRLKEKLASRGLKKDDKEGIDRRRLRRGLGVSSNSGIGRIRPLGLRKVDRIGSDKKLGSDRIKRLLRRARIRRLLRDRGLSGERLSKLKAIREVSKKKNLKKKPLDLERKGLSLDNKVSVNKPKWVNYIKVGSLIKELKRVYSEYHFKDRDNKEKLANHSIISLFGDSSIRKAQEGVETLPDAQLKENFDVPGLVEEVVNFYIEDEEMGSSEAVEQIVDSFVSKEAPEEVKEEISEFVEDIAKGVEKETKETTEEKEVEIETKEDEDKGSEGIEKEIKEVEDGVKEIEEEVTTPTAEEVGIDEVEVVSKRTADLALNKFKKVLRISAIRQALNIEPSGLYKMKINLMDEMLKKGFRKSDATEVIEKAFRNSLGEDVVGELIKSASDLFDMDDKSIGLIEKDLEKLSPVDILSIVSASDEKVEDKDVKLFAKTGSGLFEDDEFEKVLRNSLPNFGIERKR